MVQRRRAPPVVAAGCWCRVWVVWCRGCCRVGVRGVCGVRRSGLGSRLGGGRGWAVVDVGCSLGGACALGDRAVVLGGGREELLVGLGVVARGESGVGVVRGAACGRWPGVSVYRARARSGSGWAGSCMRRLPVFRDALEEVGEQFEGLLGWPLREVLFGRW